MPSYKNGWFDGKIKLLNLDDNTFPLGLVPHIYKFCNSYKINCYFTEDIINSFSEKINTSDIMYYFNTLQFFSKNKRIYPREDQFYATTRAITAKRCVNICPTSFGKSLSITMECLWYINCGLKCLIVVPTKDLVDQFYNDIKDYATNTAVFNSVSSPIWDMCTHDGYVYATIPNTAGVIMFKGHPAEGDEPANEYGWYWTEVIGKNNGIIFRIFVSVNS